MWKRPSTYVTGMALIAATSTALLPYWPKAVAVLGLNDPSRLQSVVFTLIGIHSALLVGTLTFRLLEQRHELQAAATRIEEAVRGPRVRKLRDEDFYTEFLQAARRARSSVCICYFGPDSPDSVPDRERKAYYTKMRLLMRKRGNQVRFRRLLRWSDANERWAGSEITRLLGSPRVDFALLRDLDPTTPKNVMPLALSVQIVDQEVAWIVAVQSHEQIGEFRDAVVEGGDLPCMLQLYFDRLWTHAEVILENGRLTPKGQELLNRLGMPV